MQFIDSFSIKLEYLVNFDTKFENNFKIRWETEFHYDMTIRGVINFKIKNNMEKYKEHPYLYIYIWEEIKSGSGLMNLCIMIVACCQAAMVMHRLYYGYKCLMSIKRKLEDDEEAYGTRSVRSKSEVKPFSDLDSVYIKGKTKWEMLKLTEKKNFFSLWYVLMLFSNFIQVLSSIHHLVFPVISNKHELYCSLSCLLSWVSCGYFFEYEEKYYFFYLTMKKSFKQHFKYLFVFSIIFIGLGLFLLCSFNYSEKFYSNLHMTFITMFSCLFGDSLFHIWNSTSTKNPVITILCAFFFFLFFVAFLMRMLVTITEESFECIRMRKNYYWLDQKLSVQDYIKNEVVLRDEEDDNEGQHYMLSDIFLEILLKANNLIDAVDKINVDDAIQIDLEKLESEGIFKEEVAKLIKKEIKKSMKFESLKEAENFEINEEQIETKKIKGVYKLIDNFFDKIMASIEKIDEFVRKFKLEKGHQSRNFNATNQMLLLYSNKMNYHIHTLRKILIQ